MAHAVITEDVYGATEDGTIVKIFTLNSAAGLMIRVTNYGGIITRIVVPDRNGTKASVVLNKDTLDGYLAGHPYYGALIGRYGNRIANAAFELDGTQYALGANDGTNSLHGGKTGFDKIVWVPEMITEGGRAALKLTHTSPDGDQGFPGNLAVSVTYEVSGNRLSITYEAETDKATHFNPTNHSYFDLSGGDNALGQTLLLNASAYTSVDDDLIPTGAIQDVTGTPFDFRKRKVIGDRAGETGLGFYDHNYVLDATGEDVLAACLKDPVSGRFMYLYTTEPGIQVYSGNEKGVCLETQHFPDSPNRPDFPGTVLRPGQKFFSRTIMAFGAE